MATKFGRIVTYIDNLLSTESNEPLMIWSCEIRWQTKTIISPLIQYLWPPNLAGLWLTLIAIHSKCYMTFWSRGLSRSCEKLKSWYIHYQDAYRREFRQEYDLPRGNPTHKWYDLSITPSCEITWEAKNLISPLPQPLWLQNLTGRWLILSDFYP